jgi:HEAT repeat protein
MPDEYNHVVDYYQEKTMNTKDVIKEYLIELEDDDIKVRDAARRQLASIGPAVIPDLISQLKTDKESCRREAAQILGEIHDESSADDLVEALLDDSIGVEWAASEALIKYGPDAILPLLEGITRHFDSERFRRGAYHVLHTLKHLHGLHPKVQEVLDALHNMQPRASVAWAAERAIEQLIFEK